MTSSKILWCVFTLVAATGASSSASSASAASLSDDIAYTAYDFFTPGPRDEPGRVPPTPITKNDVEIVYHETTEAAFYGSDARGLQPRRVMNITAALFEWYMERGLPIIVTDATRDMPMAGWTCESIKAEFATEKFRQEYTDGGSQRNTDIIGATDIAAASAIANGPEDKGPNFAPFYWDVKDRRSKVRRQIQSKTRLPYFMTGMVMAGPSVNASAEFWFSRPAGGAKAHIDQHCESTVSLQLSGEKRWRLSLQPKITHSLAIKRFFDGDTNTTLWRPLYDFTLKAGEGLFFPPGMIHETRNVGDTCAVSVTYQYFQPVPVIFMREWLPRLVVGSALNECPDRWGGLVTFAPSVKAPRSVAHARTRATTAFRRIDGDGDGQMSLDEVGAMFRRWDSDQLSQLVSMEVDGPALRLHDKTVRRSLARAAFRYHDVNEDGHVSEHEFVTNIVHWSGVVLQRQRGQQLLREYKSTRRRLKWCSRQDKAATEMETLRAWANGDKKAVIGATSASCRTLSDALMKAIKASAITTDILHTIPLTAPPSPVPQSSSPLPTKTEL